MKSALFLAGASAMLVSASPIRAPNAKRAYVTEWAYQVVTVTVTAGQEPAQPTAAVFLEEPADKGQEKPQPPVVVVTTTVGPEPAPTVAPEEPPKEQPVVEKPTSAEKPKPTSEPINGEIPLVDYKNAVLDHHNVHRANHSAPALEWDDTLAQYAETTGNGCVFEHDMEQGGGGYGQNLASWGSTGDIDDLRIKSAAAGISDQWYNGEVTNWSSYGASNPPEGLPITKYGHFTQLVWKGSTKVGCATVKCPAGTVLDLPAWYTVCNYSPSGNFGGEYGNNVLEPQGDVTVSV